MIELGEFPTRDLQGTRGELPEPQVRAGPEAVEHFQRHGYCVLSAHSDNEKSRIYANTQEVASQNYAAVGDLVLLGDLGKLTSRGLGLGRLSLPNLRAFGSAALSDFVDVTLGLHSEGMLRRRESYWGAVSDRAAEIQVAKQGLLLGPMSETELRIHRLAHPRSVVVGGDGELIYHGDFIVIGGGVRLQVSTNLEGLPSSLGGARLLLIRREASDISADPMILVETEVHPLPGVSGVAIQRSVPLDYLGRALRNTGVSPEALLNKQDCVHVRAGKNQFTVGRGQGVDISVGYVIYYDGRGTKGIPLKNLSISRPHVEVEASQNGIRITDLDSKNGVFLLKASGAKEWRRVDTTGNLEHGDRVRLTAGDGAVVLGVSNIVPGLRGVPFRQGWTLTRER